MAAKLTAKQEKYCQLRAAGKNQSDAYRGAYVTKNMKPEAIWVNASKIEKNAKVALRLEELNAKVEQKIVKSLVVSAERTMQLASQVLEATGQLIPLSDKNGNAILAKNAEGELVQAYAPVDGKTFANMTDKFMKHYGQYQADNKQKTPQTNVLALIGNLPQGSLQKLQELAYGTLAEAGEGDRGRIIQGS